MSSQTIAQKLLTVQKKIGGAVKSSDNPYFKSKYADLNSVLDVAKTALNDVGIFISQSPGANEFGKYLETSLIDAESGQQINGRVFFSGAEGDMQKIGAAITYARRFGLKSLLAMEDIDDDGETAVGRSQNQERTKSTGGAQLEFAFTNTKEKPSSTPSSPVQAKVPQSFNRKTCLEKISLTSKVIIDSKRDTQDNVVKMLSSFGVSSKEALSDEQAKKLLSQLEEKLNAK